MIVKADFKYDAGLFRICWMVSVFLSCMCGCSQPLRTLLAVNAEQKGQQHLVLVQDQKFQRLLEDIKASRLKPGTKRSFVLARYGDPVLEPSTESGRTLLYRNPVEFINPSKVYLDFDQQDLLVNARIEEKNVRKIE